VYLNISRQYLRHDAFIALIVAETLLIANSLSCSSVGKKSSSEESSVNDTSLGVE
jgi:hypothetical protein